MMVALADQKAIERHNTHEVDFITLTDDDNYTFTRTGQDLFIVRGSAWVTYADVDVVLAEGQRVELGTGSGEVVITNLYSGNLIFGIRYAA